MKLAWHVQSIPKAGSSEAENEDSFCLNTEGGRVAVCDGASEGWGSGAWARHLAQGLVAQPTEPMNFLQWLARVRNLAVFTAAPVMSWYAEAKSAQGAFSTFLNVVFSEASDGGTRYHAAAVGDTALFHLRDDKLIARFPIEKANQFSNRPKLVGSTPESGDVTPEWFAGRAESGDRFYLMTDALAEWFLGQAEDGGQPWQSLDAVTSAVDASAEFAQWVQSLREKKAMKNDDTTLVRVRLL